MKLFIFQVSVHWSYCSGGCAVVAESFESGVKLLDSRNDEFYYVKEELPDDDNGINYFVLRGEFDVPHEQQEKIIFFDYNWA